MTTNLVAGCLGQLQDLRSCFHSETVLIKNELRLPGTDDNRLFYPQLFCDAPTRKALSYVFH